MAKRTAADLQSTSSQGQAFQKTTAAGAKRDGIDVNDMGEFEDAWEDEIESDEEVVDAEAEDREDGAEWTWTR